MQSSNASSSIGYGVVSGVKRPRHADARTSGPIATDDTAVVSDQYGEHIGVFDHVDDYDAVVHSDTVGVKKALPGQAGADDKTQPVVIFIDFDCYYVQCVRLLQPALVGKPVGIVQKYLVVTCSYEARAFGVGKLMRTSEALQKCPQLILVNGEDLSWFRLCSDAVLQFLNHQMMDMCQRVGVPCVGPQNRYVERLVQEEFWMDITGIVDYIQYSGCPVSAIIEDVEHAHVGKPAPPSKSAAARVSGVDGHLWVPETEMASDRSNTGLDGMHADHLTRYRIGDNIVGALRRALWRVFGLTCCGGVSSNKMLSKMAAGLNKPNDQTVLMPAYAQQYMASRQVRDIPGVGWATGKVLQDMGIASVPELLRIPPLVLQSQLQSTKHKGTTSATATSTSSSSMAMIKGHSGEGGDSDAVPLTALYEMAIGNDITPITPTEPPATISDEDSFKTVTSFDEALGIMCAHLRSAFIRIVLDLLRNGRTPTVLRVSVRHNPDHKPQQHGGYNSSRVSRSKPVPHQCYLTKSDADALRRVLPSWVMNPLAQFHHVMAHPALYSAPDSLHKAYADSIVSHFSSKLSGLQTVASACLKELLPPNGNTSNSQRKVPPHPSPAAPSHAISTVTSQSSSATASQTFNISLISVAFASFERAPLRVPTHRSIAEFMAPVATIDNNATVSSGKSCDGIQHRAKAADVRGIADDSDVIAVDDSDEEIVFVTPTKAKGDLRSFFKAT